MDDDSDEQARIKYLRDLIGRASQTAIGEGNEGKLQNTPLEGYGAVTQGLPSDPGASAGIKPEGSPIDLVAGVAGAKLGQAMAQDAGSIVGNEIGSMGANIKNIPGKAAGVPIMDSVAPEVGTPTTRLPGLTSAANNVSEQAVQQAGQIGSPDMTQLVRNQQALSKAFSLNDAAMKARALDRLRKR